MLREPQSLGTFETITAANVKSLLYAASLFRHKKLFACTRV